MIASHYVLRCVMKELHFPSVLRLWQKFKSTHLDHFYAPSKEQDYDTTPQPCQTVISAGCLPCFMSSLPIFHPVLVFDYHDGDPHKGLIALHRHE